MGIDNLKVIDIVSIDKDEKVVLTISDHLEWDHENEHLLILQDKINAYLAAIESGDLYNNYPAAQGRNIKIRITALHIPNDDGFSFIKQVKEVLENAGYDFEFNNLPASDE